MDRPNNYEVFKKETLGPFWAPEAARAVYSLFGRACQIKVPQISEVARFSHMLRQAEGVQDTPSKELSEFQCELHQTLLKCKFYPDVEFLVNVYGRTVGEENIPGNSFMELMITKKSKYWYESAAFLQAAATETIHPALAHLDPETIGRYAFMNTDPAKFLATYKENLSQN